LLKLTLYEKKTLYDKEEYLKSSQDKGDGEEGQSQPFFSTKKEREREREREREMHAEADFTKDG